MIRAGAVTAALTVYEVNRPHAAGSPQHDEAGWCITPTQVNHRRYKALCAFFVDGLTYQQALRYEFA
jgi:hypothetical protein